MKTNTMKMTLKSTLAASSLAILALSFSGCSSNGSGEGTHQMGNIKGSYPMRDRDMPARRTGTSAGEGTHEMGNIKSPSRMRDSEMPGR